MALSLSVYLWQWHPFTISSARGDMDHEDFVSVHIRVHPGGWTEKLKSYFELFNPTKTYPLHVRSRLLLRLGHPHWQALIFSNFLFV